MKYRLKKDSPLADAGTIWSKSCEYEITDRNNPVIIMRLSDDVSEVFSTRTFSDWFEEVDERWNPSTGEDCWLLGEDFEEHMLFGFLEGAEFPERWLKAGRIFRTRELAKRAAEQIKALLKEFHKNNP